MVFVVVAFGRWHWHWSEDFANFLVGLVVVPAAMACVAMSQWADGYGEGREDEARERDGRR